MRTRLLIGFVGVAMGAFGALRFLQLERSDIVDAVLWLGGGVIVHDLVLAPLTIALTLLAARLVTGQARVAVVTGLIVLATVTVTAIPVLGGWGARGDNPTLLDRDYATGWLVFAGLVVAGTLIALAPWLRRRDGHGTGGGE
jgi:hypothetical protein